MSPDLTLYRVDDESALSALAKEMWPAFPPYKNMRQLLGFAPCPGGRSSKTRENWSLLEEVTWVEQSSSGIYMPLVGTALHKLSLFNAQLGTSHALTSSFRKLLTGERGFMGGWHKMKEAPAAACALESGTSLLRICSEGASPPAAHAAEQSQQVISAPPQQLQPQPLPQQSSSNPKLRTPLGKQSTGRDADSSAKRVRLGGLFSSNIFDALEDDEEQQLLAEEDLPEDLPERPEPLPPSESQRAPAGAIPACRVWCLLVAPEHADSVAAAVAILGGSARSDAGTTCAAGGARAATAAAAFFVGGWRDGAVAAAGRASGAEARPARGTHSHPPQAAWRASAALPPLHR